MSHIAHRSSAHKWRFSLYEFYAQPTKFSQTWFCTTLGSFRIIKKNSGSVLLEETIFEECFYISTCRCDFPYWVPFDNPPILHFVWSFTDSVVVGDIFPIYTHMKSGFPYHGLTLSWGSWLLWNSILHYDRKLLSRIWIFFWSSGSWGKYL
jgi:hypothetical protein